MLVTGHVWSQSLTTGLIPARFLGCVRLKGGEEKRFEASRTDTPPPVLIWLLSKGDTYFWVFIKAPTSEHELHSVWSETGHLLNGPRQAGSYLQTFAPAVLSLQNSLFPFLPLADYYS